MTGDPVWEHKKGKVWQIVARQERQIKMLRIQNRTLRLSIEIERERRQFEQTFDVFVATALREHDLVTAEEVNRLMEIPGPPE